MPASGFLWHTVSFAIKRNGVNISCSKVKKEEKYKSKIMHKIINKNEVKRMTCRAERKSKRVKERKVERYKLEKFAKNRKYLTFLFCHISFGAKETGRKENMCVYFVPKYTCTLFSSPFG